MLSLQARVLAWQVVAALNHQLGAQCNAVRDNLQWLRGWVATDMIRRLPDSYSGRLSLYFARRRGLTVAYKYSELENGDASETVSDLDIGLGLSS
jgi:hypothetical protein